MLDPQTSFEIDAELEAVLWPMVDYGAMCSSSGAAEPGATSISVNISPTPFLDFDMDLAPGNAFDLPASSGLSGTRSSMSSYGINCS